jgi:geranylgeranyl pyrophosphate synthase
MSALGHWHIARARKERLNQGLLTLFSWAAGRAAGDHDEDTTLSMLKRKTAELCDAVDRAGWLASTKADESEREMDTIRKDIAEFERLKEGGK